MKLISLKSTKTAPSVSGRAKMSQKWSFKNVVHVLRKAEGPETVFSGFGTGRQKVFKARSDLSCGKCCPR